MEVYKPIAGAPAFMVSNFGNICSVDRYVNSGMKGKFGALHPCSKTILQKKNGLVIMEYNGTRDAERKTGITRQGILSAIKGRAKTAGGFEWCYKEVSNA